MTDLIEALTIFRKYADRRNPTICTHDTLIVADIGCADMTPDDRARVEALGFFWSESEECWMSFRFGSA